MLLSFMIQGTNGRVLEVFVLIAQGYTATVGSAYHIVAGPIFRHRIVDSHLFVSTLRNERIIAVRVYGSWVSKHCQRNMALF